MTGECSEEVGLIGPVSQYDVDPNDRESKSVKNTLSIYFSL